MIIQQTNKWVYIGPPKTGSTSLHKYLISSPFFGSPVDCTSSLVDEKWQHECRIPEMVDDSYTIFISCRNPYRRIVSLWLHCCNQSKNFLSPIVKSKHPLLPFPEFVDFVIDSSNKVKELPGMWDPQIKYTEPCKKKGYKYTRWKLEKIDECIKESSNILRPLIDTPVVPTLNATRLLMDLRKHTFKWPDVYTSDLIKKVVRWAEEDFLEFEYSKEFMWALPDTPVVEDPIARVVQ